MVVLVAVAWAAGGMWCLQQYKHEQDQLSWQLLVAIVDSSTTSSSNISQYGGNTTSSLFGRWGRQRQQSMKYVCCHGNNNNNGDRNISVMLVLVAVTAPQWQQLRYGRGSAINTTRLKIKEVAVASGQWQQQSVSLCQQTARSSSKSPQWQQWTGYQILYHGYSSYLFLDIAKDLTSPHSYRRMRK